MLDSERYVQKSIVPAQQSRREYRRRQKRNRRILQGVIILIIILGVVAAIFLSIYDGQFSDIRFILRDRTNIHSSGGASQLDETLSSVEKLYKIQTDDTYPEILVELAEKMKRP